MAEIDLIHLPARPAMDPCPRCGGMFERPIFEGGVEIRGHSVGHPKICIPLPKTGPTAFQRDARTRPQARR